MSQDYSDKLLLLKCVEFDGAPSVQEESKDLIYKWTFGDGTPDNYGQKVEHCYDSVGVFKASLSVIEPTTKIIFTEEHNMPVEIVADLILDVSVRNISESKFEFTPDLKGDLDFENVTFFWDFGDGKYGVSEVATHEYLEKSSYTIRLLTRLQVDDEEYHLAKELIIEI